MFVSFPHELLETVLSKGEVQFGFRHAFEIYLTSHKPCELGRVNLPKAQCHICTVDSTKIIDSKN